VRRVDNLDILLLRTLFSFARQSGGIYIFCVIEIQSNIQRS